MGVFVLQPGIGLIQLASPVPNPGLKQYVGGVNRFGGAAAGQRRVDMAGHKRQQFLIAQGIADILGITLHHQYATNLPAVEQGDAQPGRRSTGVSLHFDFSEAFQPAGVFVIDQARSPLADHVFGKAALPAP
ncbi:Phosphotransacetylase [Pseudomonas syringae pv. actinidiae]|uniref:Phosphotransacetylase n=1 Tax=Pseudomonas syringae pv. actinidiae TaxID=103796 RepID=A0A2V0QH54_PSESF|nr:Phosphotransacetylase [Pseudomonas syringae pv. actinidiae]